MRQIRQAFTMLELVFVIVILGIVASVGASIMAQTFETYLMQRAVHSASIKTELAINQIANRLTYYMRDSLLARKPETTTAVDGINAIPLANVPANDKVHNMLEWIGYDNDGFTANTTQHGWSGVCDLGTSDFDSLITPASRLLNDAETSPSEGEILKNLFPYIKNPAIRFLTDNYRAGTPYTTACMYAGKGKGCMFPVQIKENNLLKFTKTADREEGQMIYSEFYQLAGSAYALVPVSKGTLRKTKVAVWDLMLHYNYSPWSGQNYMKNGTSQLLAHNVSVFRFRQEGNTVRIKLCTVEQIGDTDTISICKEKAVLR